MNVRAAAVRAENALAMAAMGGVMLLPLAEIVVRRAFGVGIPGAGPFAQSLTLWVGLLGAAIAARDGKLLSLATGEFLPKGRISTSAHLIAGIVGACVSTLFAMGGVAFVQGRMAAGTEIAVGVKVWVAGLVFPFAFGLIALRLAYHASPKWAGRGFAALGIIAGLWLSQHLDAMDGMRAWPWIAMVIGAAILGAPIFVLLGGIGLFAFLTDGSAPVVLLIKAHEELTQSVGLAAIPLFTLAGFLLAEGKSSQRLLRVLRAVFGWAPGGTAVASASLCAFFTLLTGGSGVTILALGGLLLPALIADKYREKFSIGLLTASGSLGLLFPLSVPLILYAIVAKVPMDKLFIGGLLPGLFMLALMAALGVREGMRSGATRTPFRVREAVAAIAEAKWELLLPVVVLVVMLGGLATPVESAAVAALFAFVVQRFIHRDLPSMWDVMRVVSDCVALVGGVLLILSVAVGLTNYLVNADFASRMVDWTQAHVHSRIVFLLCLNVFLLVVGCLMDIFSAIVVVVPLILQFVEPYHLNLVHLGIIFVANLELGYLHPPVGLNLLLASVRFKKPVLQVTWATLPMLGILALGVLLITYVPWLTTGLLDLLGMN
jgi:C4-dicarboxylate transporter DctM subunit